TLFGGYAVGNHTVAVTLPANCTLASGVTPRTVAVPSGTTIQTVATTFDLTCTSTGGGNNVTVSFAACPAADRAVWLAAKDGSGAWVPVTGVADVYTFGITSGAGGIAYVVLGTGSTSQIQVMYRTQAEWTSGTLDLCATPPATRSFTGTVVGLGGPTESARLSLGGGSTFASFHNPGFQIDGVSDGTHDLVGFRSDFATTGTERALLRRDVVVSGNGTLGTVDFTGSESFAPTSATITVGGLLGGEFVTQSQFYQVGASCQAAILVPSANGGATFTAFGVPALQQRAGDYHRIQITAGSLTDVRIVGESFHTMAARTITLGAALSAPVISNLGGPYKRLSAAYTLPGDYQALTAFTYTNGAGDKTVYIGASFGFLGGSSVTLGLDDFSALAGWSNTWAPASASTGSWSTFGSGGNIAGSACVENANFKSAAISGIF
ncbi:MAG: hypothetical protein OEW77_12835, partial [Gemmatimonadota bacterium]|nr:hypothetical protein [Gemmatimonadota bacterium]